MSTAGTIALAPACASGFGWRLLRAWPATVVSIALILALPVFTIFSFVFYPAGDVWHHLVATVLTDYVLNSLLLMTGVAAGTLLIGVSTAWLTTHCEFPGRGFFVWTLLLPLSIPAYIIAYTYTGILDFAGPVQTALRSWFHWSAGEYWFPDVRSIWGAVAMLSLVLYPYVYLLARSAFLEQSVAISDASRLLGASPLTSFRRVALPMARPAIIAGLSLALMETLADYGTVQYFGVSTFTTGIFRTWFGLGDSSAAAQLSALLLSFVFILMVLERWSRHRAQFYHVGSRSQPLRPYALRGWRRWLAVAVCLVPLLLGFLLPAAQLAWWTQETAAEMLDRQFMQLMLNSFSLAAAAAFLAVLLAVVIAYGKRLHPTRIVAASARVAGMGYAIPGTVIAVGVMLPLAWLDNSIDAWFRQYFSVSTGLWLSGTLFALMFAYLVRFLAVSLQTVESGLTKVRPSMDDAARSLGYSPAQVLRLIHLPIVRGSLLTASLIVFVDVLKELPATLILRPFNFNTLAVRTYELASDERLADSSSAALAIVLVGLLPVILLSRSIAHTRATDRPVAVTPGPRSAET